MQKPSFVVAGCRTRGLIVVLASAAFMVAAPGAAAQDRPAAACSAERILGEETKLASNLAALPGRFPWFKSASLVCNGLAMGSRADQAASLTACVARECAGGRQAGACPADASNIYNAVDASARRRAELQGDRLRCSASMEAAAARDPLAAYFLLQLAMSHGDEATLRRLSFGPSSDFAALKVPLDFSQAVEGFMKQSADSLGPLAAEFARLEFAGSIRARSPMDSSSYRVAVNGDEAEITAPDMPSPAHFRRVNGTWKDDLTGNAANKDASTPDAEVYFRLLTAGYERVTELMQQKRIAWPATGVSAAQGCMQTGALLSSIYSDKGIGLCREYVDRRFPAPEGSHGDDDGSFSGGFPAAPEARAADAGPTQQLLDAAFQRWSTRWFVDRYVPGSALVDQQRCSGDTCNVSGEFTVIRVGQQVAVAFFGTLAKKPDGLTLSRLCYDDASSGTKDCMR